MAAKTKKYSIFKTFLLPTVAIASLLFLVLNHTALVSAASVALGENEVGHAAKVDGPLVYDNEAKSRPAWIDGGALREQVPLHEPEPKPKPIIPPYARLDWSIVVGNWSQSSRGQYFKSFLGIPYAQPPIGDRRFRLPEPVSKYRLPVMWAQNMGPACPQQRITLPELGKIPTKVLDILINSIYNLKFPGQEDCLTINVITPRDATPDSRLPVVAWIFGGGFEIGAPQMYDGTRIVERSVEIGQPVIYVSMNYRLSGFGFLASKEVKDAGVGNLGLQDQREALRWIQKYIGAFGGDPSKVTIWGESAGAISVALHMLADGGDTKGLFRAGFMQSGSPIPVGDITSGQKYYDAIVKETGCAECTDTLECLRKLKYKTLKRAIDKSPGIFAYQSLNLAWVPRADGIFLTDAPQRLVQQGKVANIPIVSGDCNDEGTFFSFSSLNVTTPQHFADYVKTQFIPNITNSNLQDLLDAYPDSPEAGSPYETFDKNNLTPQFKRIASFQGDAIFQAPRRFFLDSLSGKQRIWSFLSKRGKEIPLLGAHHASDLANIYSGQELTDYLIGFATNLDPNGRHRLLWPEYTSDKPLLLTLLDHPLLPVIEEDLYRSESMKTLIRITLNNPVF